MNRSLQTRGIVLLAILLSQSIPSSAGERDTHFSTEQYAVEAARYLYRIEGDYDGAKHRLESLFAQSKNEAIKSQASYLLGCIYEQINKRDSALAAYSFALLRKGLPRGEKIKLYRHLSNLNPSSVTPIVEGAQQNTGPSKVFPFQTNGQSTYALEYRGPPDGQLNRSKQLLLQDVNGDLVSLNFHLEEGEEILDVEGNQCLFNDPSTHKISLRPLQGGKNWNLQIQEPTEAGAILANEPGSILLITPSTLRYYRQGQPYWVTPLDQDGCVWIAKPEKSVKGLLQCAENHIYQVDVQKKSIYPIGGIKSKVLSVAWESEFVIVRYIDRFEIRNGSGFETVKWEMTSPLQEKIVLGNNRVYLVNAKGVVKSLKLETGQLEWQHDLLVSQMAAFDGVLFATTFAQTAVCLDLHGRTLWTHEYGWDREPMLLPNEEWLVLHYGDGRSLKLNRELLSISGNADSFKFREYHDKELQKDWKGALSALSHVLTLEPGNGEAWKSRAAVLKNMGGTHQEQVQALIEVSRSMQTPNWSSGPTLKNMAIGLGATWAWKRQFGPKFYPTLVPHKENSFYLENDNQTLVLLNHESGELVNSFHFSEELDMKVSVWKNDTICVSSPSRLYFIPPVLSKGGLGQIPLKNPVCQAQAVTGGLVYSDWYGGLNMVGFPDRTLRWEKKLGQSGLLVGKSKYSELLDIIDLEGKYFAISPSSGKVIWSLPLAPGTITETFSNKDFIYAGYNQGTLICIDRARQSIAWTVDFGEQIFSLSGNRDNTLVLTTASKKLICLQAATGALLSQVRIQSYLFNRPTVFDHGYWIGTTEPALEKRNFNHELLLKYKLPDLPGSPVMFGNSIFIGTLDNFILTFPS